MRYTTSLQSRGTNAIVEEYSPVNFQLVRASDNEIAIWNTDHGHIFVYAIEPRASTLTPVHCRDIPDAEFDAASMKDEAYRFATEEARVRRLLG